MKTFQRLRNHQWLALGLAAFWAIGAAYLYSQLPIEPRATFQPEYAQGIGATKDGLRYLTCGVAGVGVNKMVDNQGPQMGGPLRLWNTQTGQKIAEHFTERDAIEYLPMPGERFRIMAVDVRETPQVRRDFFLDCHCGTLTPTQSRPNFGPQPSIHPKRDFIICDARLPQTGMDWVDVETGRVIRTFPDANLWFQWTTDCKHYAYQNGDGIVVCRASDHSIVSKVADFKAIPRILSLTAGILVDNVGQVWDIRSGDLLWTDSTNAFNQSGVDLIADESAFVWRKSTNPWEIVHVDARTGQEIPGKRFRWPLGEEGPFGGEAGSYWIACVNFKSPSPPSNLEMFLQRLPLLGRRLTRQELYSTVLIDSNSLTEFFRGPGHLLSVSNDRKTVITSCVNGYATWDVPGRTSWQTIALALIGWTFLWFAASSWLIGMFVVLPRYWRKS